ncbi:hypothetical protein AMPC_16900 [Anaeromyxobacter paludicola]|uniref:TOTE conflict system primase domain-containing protein n=1 Tax=Anaeromyxobacter paludicola TaxID=2918171 RepID=A0ABN6N5W0_9BACT|nr:hypothetical protein AMPC_16900 [Anaeromyxobacter paludicola]
MRHRVMTTVRQDLAKELARLEARLAAVDAEGAALREQIQRLRDALSAAEPVVAAAVPTATVAGAKVPATASEKVTLFSSLFRGRADVYPRFWSNERKGTKGYSPRCLNEWDRPLCQKPKTKCSECLHQDFEPVSSQVIQDHLLGRHVIGIYPLLRGESCHLLAVDFDKGSWADDVGAFAETCRATGISVAVERSRSGAGAHAWFFFEEPVPAALARRLGCYLLTETMSRRPQIGMDSYDRALPEPGHHAARRVRQPDRAPASARGEEAPQHRVPGRGAPAVREPVGIPRGVASHPWDDRGTRRPGGPPPGPRARSPLRRRRRR